MLLLNGLRVMVAHDIGLALLVRVYLPEVRTSMNSSDCWLIDLVSPNFKIQRLGGHSKGGLVGRTWNGCVRTSRTQFFASGSLIATKVVTLETRSFDRLWRTLSKRIPHSGDSGHYDANVDTSTARTTYHLTFGTTVGTTSKVSWH